MLDSREPREVRVLPAGRVQLETLELRVLQGQRVVQALPVQLEQVRLAQPEFRVPRAFKEQQEFRAPRGLPELVRLVPPELPE